MTVTVSGDNGFSRQQRDTFGVQAIAAYSFKDLPAGTYTVRVKIDSNRNGFEDTGDLSGNRTLRFDGSALYSQDVKLEPVL